MLLSVNFFGWGSIPIGSMYGIFTYIYHKNQLNVGKCTIHGSYRELKKKIHGNGNGNSPKSPKPAQGWVSVTDSLVLAGKTTVTWSRKEGLVKKKAYIWLKDMDVFKN